MVDPTDYIDEQGQPKPSSKEIPVFRLARGLGVALFVAALGWGAWMGAWSSALTLAGLVLDIAGATILAWPVVRTWAEEVREAEVASTRSLASKLSSPYIVLGRSREELFRSVWGIGMLIGGFAAQAVGVIVGSRLPPKPASTSGGVR